MFALIEAINLHHHHHLVKVLASYPCQVKPSPVCIISFELHFSGAIKSRINIYHTSLKFHYPRLSHQVLRNSSYLALDDRSPRFDS